MEERDKKKKNNAEELGVNFFWSQVWGKREKEARGKAAYMVERECRVAKDPGAMLEILLS